MDPAPPPTKSAHVVPPPFFICFVFAFIKLKLI